MNKELAEKVIESLKDNNISATYFDSVHDAKQYILASIGSNKAVGFGGSITLQDINLHQELKDNNNQVYWHWLEGSPEGRKSALNQAAVADVYLTSANAITLQGEIVNVDGNGNRITGMIYGPKKSIIVVGVNKISHDLIDALDRVRKHAAPPNAKRLNRKTPCAVTGECSDCNSPERICNVTTIIHKKPGTIDMEVILIGENLGY